MPVSKDPDTEVGKPASAKSTNPQTKLRKLKSSTPLTWPRLWSIARNDLRLSSEEWLDLTPKLVYELEHRHLEELQQYEMIGAIIAHTTAHFSASPPKSHIPIEKFMVHPIKNRSGGAGGPNGLAEDSSDEPMTGDAIMAVMTNLRTEMEKGQITSQLARAKPSGSH